MYIFMFMSGYVAYVADENTLKKKIRKRLPTYLLPAFMLCWLSFPIAVFMGKKEWGDFFTSALTGGFWYLKCLAIFCLLQYPIVKCRKLWLELSFAAIVYVIFAAMWKLYPQYATEQYIPFEHCVCFYPSFLIGYYFRKYSLMQKLAQRNWIFSVCLIGYVYLYFADIQAPVIGNVCNRYIRPTLAILFITYLFLQQEGSTNWFLRKLEYFGRNSLDVYLFNGYFVLGYTMIDMTAVRDWTEAHNMPFATLLVAITVSVIIAYCCVWIGKLLHTSNLLEKWLYGKIK